MKLTKYLIGKKLVRTYDTCPCFFTPLAITSTGIFVGEDLFGRSCMYVADKFDDWQFYEKSICEKPKQKKRIEAAPAVIKRNGEWHITTRTYFSFEEAQCEWGEHFITWPCPFDKEKGVFYYEWEE